MVDVVELEGEAGVHVEGAAAGDLHGAGEAGFDGEALAFAVGILGDDPGFFGAGADEGHVADEDVPELGQLVEGPAAQEAADAGDAGVGGVLEGVSVGEGVGGRTSSRWASAPTHMVRSLIMRKRRPFSPARGWV